MNLRTIAVATGVSFLAGCLAAPSADDETSVVRSPVVFDSCAHDAPDALTAYPASSGDIWAIQNISSNGASYAADGVFACKRFIVDLSMSYLSPRVVWPYQNHFVLMSINPPPTNEAACKARVDNVSLYRKDEGDTEFTLVKSTHVTYTWWAESGASGCTGVLSAAAVEMPPSGTTVYRYAASIQSNGVYQPVTVKIAPQP